ncbi:hypothetical protein CAL7716_106980 (plasmid) [Calothrix sp. PCC 7716]|nr:hypothetical protein CAL7716_106980 [Calothrix sp. PCC 7716]
MSDALERLKKRNRPTVESRDASLNSTNLDTSISRIMEAEISGINKSQKTQGDASSQPLETKQSTLRLDIGVSERLQSVCREHGICREVLIEAMFEYCDANPEVKSVVLSEARKKNDYRQQMANMRRAKSMIQKFG